jgi:hypothetical protein
MGTPLPRRAYPELTPAHHRAVERLDGRVGSMLDDVYEPEAFGTSRLRLCADPGSHHGPVFGEHLFEISTRGFPRKISNEDASSLGLVRSVGTRSAAISTVSSGNGTAGMAHAMPRSGQTIETRRFDASRQFQVAKELSNLRVLAVRDKCDDNTCCSSPSGPPGAVDVVLVVGSHVEMHDGCHILYVDSPGCDIGGH